MRQKSVFEDVMEEDYKSWSIIYTDYSKIGQGVGITEVFNEAVKKTSLPMKATIGNAEARAIQQAIGMMRENAVTQCVICTDLLSAIEMLQNFQVRNELTEYRSLSVKLSKAESCLN